MTAYKAEPGTGKTLKEYCKNTGYTFRQRRQGSRYYVTIGDKEAPFPKDWLTIYRNIVLQYYPDAYMTSGSAYGATFMVGDIMAALKSKT